MQRDPSQPSHHDEEEYDFDKLVDKITSLKNRLIEIGHQSNSPVNLSGRHYKVIPFLVLLWAEF